MYRNGSQKHNYIYVTYKVLVYTQTSQPTTCFGLFQLGHLQVGHKAKTQLHLCNVQGVGVYTNVSANYMFRPLLVRPSSGCIQPEDDLNRRGRNM